MTRRENRSITTARYRNPSCVRIYVMSVTYHRQAIACNRREAELVRRIHIELPVQGIVRHHTGAATIRARLLFVTNLGPYARQSCQTPSSVGADVFAEIAQVIVQLAVSVDLATFLPSRFDELGLPPILQRSPGKRFAQPSIKAARMHCQHPAHRTHCEHQPVLSYERIPHPLPGSGCLHPREGGFPGEVCGRLF
jgi:hypothetical protein